MEHFDYVNALHTLLSSSETPVPRQDIQKKLQCTETELKKIIENMRLYLNAPIKFDRETKSYFYATDPDAKYELPGLWFNSSELYGLFASYQLLSEVGPGLFDSHIAPIKEKLKSLLYTDTINNDDIEKRIKILKMAARKSSPKHFSLVATALLMRKQLAIRYAGRDRNITTERTLSPQRLVHYRDNWYIDAWCHLREQLRTFAVDRIEFSRLVNVKAMEVDEAVLNEHFSAAYGIFSGKANKTAVLKFSKPVAKWVAEELWHPEQLAQFDIDGCYHLEIPYRDQRELIQDILKYGADVEVIKPDKLREEIKLKLEQTCRLYGESSSNGRY